MQRVPFSRIDGSPYSAWWQERFDPPTDPFAKFCFYQRGRSIVWVGSACLDGLEAARTDAVGVPMLRIGRRFWKPTSVAVVRFGSGARRNVVDLTRGEARGFMGGEPIRLAGPDGRRACLSRGFVVARYHGVALGCGELFEDTVTSLLPVSKRVPEIGL